MALYTGRVPDSKTIQMMEKREERIPCGAHRANLQNRYSIGSVAPKCVAIKRLQLAINQLWTLGMKAVSVRESCERFVTVV